MLRVSHRLTVTQVGATERLQLRHVRMKSPAPVGAFLANVKSPRIARSWVPVLIIVGNAGVCAGAAKRKAFELIKSACTTSGLRAPSSRKVS
jgi:hypothetical protein